MLFSPLTSMGSPNIAEQVCMYAGAATSPLFGNYLGTVLQYFLVYTIIWEFFCEYSFTYLWEMVRSWQVKNLNILQCFVMCGPFTVSFAKIVQYLEILIGVF